MQRLKQLREKVIIILKKHSLGMRIEYRAFVKWVIKLRVQ